jgi:Protein of unknown function (DUF5818)
MSMRRTSTWGASLLLFSPFLFAQQAAQQPSPQLPASVLGPQLVAWSELQKPHPAPQPLPPPQPDPPAQTQPQTSTASQDQPSSQAFTGTIVKDGTRYVLKVSDNTSYQIDDQDKAKLFEGKQVRIAGSLDAKSNTLHVTSIELLS